MATEANDEKLEISDEEMKEELEELEIEKAHSKRWFGIPMDQVKSHLKNTQSMWILGGLVVYFLVSLAYMGLEEWGVGDCVYFSIVVVTTVGYGDFLPSTDLAKLVTVVYVHFALVIVVVAISNIQDAIVSHTIHRAVSRLKMDQHRTGVFDKAQAQKRRWIRLCTFLVIHACTLIVGMLVYGLVDDFEDGEVPGNKWVNGLYMTVITMSTVGFGDICPVNDGTKVFTSILMLIGIPVFGATLGCFSDVMFGEGQQSVHLQVVQGNLSKDKFESMHAFVQKLREEGIGNYAQQGHGKISRFEYMCFLLVQNGVIGTNNIKRMMVNFERIDKSGTGFIEMCDVEESVRCLDMMLDDTSPAKAAPSETSV